MARETTRLRRRRRNRTEALGAGDRALLDEIDDLLANEPSYQVCSFDGLHWLDPVTGKLVPAPFEWRDAARHFLRSNQHWRDSHAKSPLELHKICWAHHLREHLEQEKRLRLFDSTWRWLNPLTGVWSDQVQATEGTIDLACLRAMANELGSDLDNTPEAMRSFDELLQIQRRALADEPRLERRPSGPVDNAKISNRLSPPRPTELLGTAPATTQYIRRPPEAASLEVDRARARAVQQKILRGLPDLPGFEHAVLYEPYEHIGGDFYEMLPIGAGRWLLIVGDVSGHGTQAALIVTSALKTLRFLCAEEGADDLLELLCRFNDEIFDDLLSGQFLACFAAIIDTVVPTITYSCAGLHEALVGNVDGRQVLERIGDRGMAIGLMRSSVLRRHLVIEQRTLRPGDTLMVYTDGLSEARNSRQQELGDWMVYGAFCCQLPRPPAKIVHLLHRQVLAWVDQGLEDDLTLLVLRYHGSEADEPAGNPVEPTAVVTA